MVKLTVTPTAKTAIEEYCSRKWAQSDSLGDDDAAKLKTFQEAGTGSPIEHIDLVNISGFLVQLSRENRDGDEEAKNLEQWRLDALLKGALVYQPPPPKKPEPVRSTTTPVPPITDTYGRQPSTKHSCNV